MGACASSPNVKKDGSNNKADAGRSEGSDRGQANGDESPAGHPDFGLKDSHELIKFLGRGGTGDTWLFREKATGDAVAIKLIKRPIPKVVMPNILREIRVSLACRAEDACKDDICCTPPVASAAVEPAVISTLCTVKRR